MKAASPNVSKEKSEDENFSYFDSALGWGTLGALNAGLGSAARQLFWSSSNIVSNVGKGFLGGAAISIPLVAIHNICKAKEYHPYFILATGSVILPIVNAVIDPDQTLDGLAENVAGSVISTAALMGFGKLAGW